LEPAEVKFESLDEPAAADPELTPSKYSIIFRALLPVPEANMAIWMGAAVEKEVAADETDDEVGAADAVEGAATDLPNPNTFAPTRLKYPLKKRN
jgi:hypothetical protein